MALFILPGGAALEQGINTSEMRAQCRRLLLIFAHQHKFQFRIQILDQRCHLLVLQTTLNKMIPLHFKPGETDLSNLFYVKVVSSMW